jgi:ABC-type glycerol-3-phosphate transport system substrate-binding protein
MVLLIGLFSGCQTSEGKKKGEVVSETETKTDGEGEPIAEEDLPLVKYSVYYGVTGQLPPWIDNPDDVVTPYVENKFKLQIEEVVWPAGMPNRLNTLIASNSVPEVILLDPNGVMDVIDKGIVKELTELIPQYMPTYWTKYLLDVDKAFCQVDGKVYWVYKRDAGRERTPEENLADPYFVGGGHAPFVREDILAQCGYSFKSIKEIEQDCIAEGRVPTEEEMQITPAIATPDDFYEFLKKVKSLDIKVGDLPMIPWSTTWSIFHFGSMFNFGHWKWDDEQQTCYAYLGAPEAKEYFKYLAKLYQEELLDKDFLVQKTEDLRQKVGSGRVAVCMNDVEGLEGVRQALQEMDPSYQLRPIPWPEKDDNHGYYDVYSPAWFLVLINKDVSDDLAIRLLKMWDWMYTDEGYDILVWGPEEAGFWEIKDGKKVFKDPEMWEISKARKLNAGGPDQYGLHAMEGFYGGGNLWSKIANCSGGPSNGGIRGTDRSYPPDTIDVFRRMAYWAAKEHTLYDSPSTKGSYGVGELVGKTSTFYWSEFTSKYLPGLLTAESDAEFDKEWDNMYKDFLRITEYEKAVEIMTEWFRSMGN